jgi:nitrite reductase/ring-hydroxylating ferredoxin subunit
MTWKKTGVALATLPVGGVREVMVDSRSVLLVRLPDGVFAVDAVCPHLGGLLGDGTLSGSRLTCPEHAAVFDVKNGRVVADPFGVEPPEGAVEPLSAYPTRVETGLIEVDLSEP